MKHGRRGGMAILKKPKEGGGFMRAVLFRDYGGPEKLELAELPDPAAGPGEVLVDVHAASVNPIDWKMRAGILRAAFDLELPHVLGRDVSGVVAGIGEGGGEGVDSLAPGDAVFGLGDPMKPGTHAERIAIAGGLVAKKPDHLSHAEAAALGVAGLSVLAALETAVTIERGQTVLIHAGAGGVGHLAIRYAKHRGARVLATASARNHDFVRGHGADEVIDYTATDFRKAAHDCDVVLDPMGGEVHARSLEVLRPGGTLVFLIAAPIPEDAKRDDVQVVMAQVKGGTARLERVAALAGEGVLTPAIERRFPLADMREAYALIESGHSRGKVVLEMRPD
jgi:NADPH:quinone reductase-like Zn-dependent oxidoreductase